MSWAQKELIIQTIIEEYAGSPPTMRGMPKSRPKTILVGGKVYKVAGKHKEK